MGVYVRLAEARHPAVVVMPNGLVAIVIVTAGERSSNNRTADDGENMEFVHDDGLLSKETTI